ncbi:MAG TPA: CRISPR-associated endonuclease Cas6 [Bacteroidales bacterium]|nr:CRISPR-associated endonuclease Cas6 [Bacteroidales bacterium]
MVKLRTIYISFEEPIRYNELNAFRSAIIEKAGRNHILFHNHLDDQQYLYRYPRIQYKIDRHHPIILCMNEGIDEIHHFFSKPSWDLFIYDKPYKVKVNKLLVNQYNMQVWDTSFRYSLQRWHALSQENYKIFKSITHPDEQKQKLEQILVGNILSFAKGIEWTVDKEIKVQIESIENTRWIPFKQTKIQCFDIIFNTNVFLPNYIGLGKNVSYGFGIVKQIKNKLNGNE